MPEHVKLATEADRPDIGEAHTQPSVRVLLTWTPAQIRSAESSADSGHMSHAAELVDSLLADESIGGAVETRTGGLQGLPLTFEEGRGAGTGESELSDPLTEDWWRSYPETVLKQLAAWGIVLGVAFAEQIWTVNADGRFAPTLKFWHPKHFRWDAHTDQWMVNTENEGEIAIEAGDPRWLVYTPYGADRPWARGLWRGLSRWWMLKSYAISDWGLHGEQASRLVVSHNIEDPRARGMTKTQRGDLASDLAGLGKDGVVVLPSNVEMALLEATANTRDIYGAQVEAANEAFVIAVNGQNLTSSVKGGSLAAANVHERVEARRLRSDGEMLSTTVRVQSVVFWTLWNFGASAMAPWPQWATEPPEDTLATSEVMDGVSASLVKFKTAGYEVKDVDEMAQSFGIPEIKKIKGTGGDDAGNAGDDGEPLDPDDGDDTGDDAPDGIGSGGDDAGSDAEARMKVYYEAKLASGELLAKAQGFLEGQIYADALSEDGAATQAVENVELVDALSAALDAEDYDAIGKAVRRAYGDIAAPATMAAAQERLFIMAQRAGHVAVEQDA